MHINGKITQNTYQIFAFWTFLLEFLFCLRIMILPGFFFIAESNFHPISMNFNEDVATQSCSQTVLLRNLAEAPNLQFSNSRQNPLFSPMNFQLGTYVHHYQISQNSSAIELLLMEI